LLAIREALRRGDKIGAVNLYREVSSVGLAEAKDFVEHIEIGLLAATSAAALVEPSLSGPDLDRIREALKCCDKITAIKIYRETHHVGLAEAKKSVEALESKLFVTKPSFLCQQRSLLLSRRISLWTYPILTLSSFCFGMDHVTRAWHGEHFSRTALWYPWIAFICLTLATIHEYRQRARLKKT
jgi:ribosomal protein L7/L12